MSPRAYNATLRKEIEAETMHRIIVATVELHAEKGALATTHAEIAARAGVSVATVYKHFPSKDALLPHCTGMVSQHAPHIDVQTVLAAGSCNSCLRQLVLALHQQYRYFHPWIRWVPHAAPALPLLAEFTETNRRHTESLVREVLEHILGVPVADDTFALAMVILDYPAWQRLEQMLHDPDLVHQTAEQGLQLLLAKLPQQKERK